MQRVRGNATRFHRRQALWLIGSGFAGVALIGCGSVKESQQSNPSLPNFAARFQGFEPADEPNGELAKVAWPAFILNAGGDIQALYEFQILNGDLMRYMPCFCGCQWEDGHRNNRDCYIETVNADGSVIFDSMAPT